MGEDSGRWSKTPTAPAIWEERTQYNRSRHTQNLDGITTALWHGKRVENSGWAGGGGVLTFGVQGGDWHQACMLISPLPPGERTRALACHMLVPGFTTTLPTPPTHQANGLGTISPVL